RPGAKTPWKRCRSRPTRGLSTQAPSAASCGLSSTRSIRCSSAEQRTATRRRTNLCMSIPPASRDASDAADRFHTTHWSLVAAAQDRASPEAQRALTELCEVYWYPLYAFIRRSGHGSEEARDLTQEFFARLLEKDYLAGVDREKGKFRSFLLTACKHFL